MSLEASFEGLRAAEEEAGMPVYLMDEGASASSHASSSVGLSDVSSGEIAEAIGVIFSPPPGEAPSEACEGGAGRAEEGPGAGDCEGETEGAGPGPAAGSGEALEEATVADRGALHPRAEPRGRNDHGAAKEEWAGAAGGGQAADAVARPDSDSDNDDGAAGAPTGSEDAPPAATAPAAPTDVPSASSPPPPLPPAEDGTPPGGGGEATRLAAPAPVREDDTSPAWRGREKHFFILSNAGKPVYSLHGDEDLLAGFMAVIQAIISTVEDSGDHVRHVLAGGLVFVFAARGPLYLVAAASTGEHVEVLRHQLDLLHAQVVFILTQAFERAFARRSTYDMRGLMGGTSGVIESLVESFTWDPSAWLCAFPPLALPQAVRHALGSSMRRAAAGVMGASWGGTLLHALVTVGGRVAMLATAKKHPPMHPEDMLLLRNFVRANDSFRTSEAFTPVCLPRYNPGAFLYAYMGCLEGDVCLVLMSASKDSFYQLAEVRSKMEAELRAGDSLDAIARAVARGDVTISELPPEAGGGGVGETALWHFVYKSSSLHQFVAPAFTPPLEGPRDQVEVLREYQRLHALVYSGGPAAPHRVHFSARDARVVLACVGTEFELYATLDPLADQVQAVAIANRLCAWMQREEHRFFAF